MRVRVPGLRVRRDPVRGGRVPSSGRKDVQELHAGVRSAMEGGPCAQTRMTSVFRATDMGPLHQAPFNVGFAPDPVRGDSGCPSIDGGCRTEGSDRSRLGRETNLSHAVILLEGSAVLFRVPHTPPSHPRGRRSVRLSRVVLPRDS